MKALEKNNAAEWGFVLAMIALCATLTALQYRWTGDLARAEMTRLRANLGEQARQLTLAFDSDLAAGSSALLPTRTEVEELGSEAAHTARFRQWMAAKPRPIFSRIAVAVPGEKAVRLSLLDQKTGQLAPAAWPGEWEALQDNLERKLTDRSGPFTDTSGVIIEFPIFGSNERGMGREIEWLILEINLNYASTVWMPDLVRAFLNLGGQPLYDVVVKVGMSPGTVVYASRADASGNRETPLIVPFNLQGWSAASITMFPDSGPHGGPRGESPDGFPPRRGGGPDGGSGGPPSRAADGRWTLEVRHRPDAFDAGVAASRTRNLTVGVVLNGLILAAGCLLLQQTRRSRRLAAAQMNFVATVSHELRTPLTVIRGAAHNLQRGVVSDPDRIAQYSGLILGNAAQLTEMVEQVLAFAGANKRLPAESRHPVALDQLLRDAIAAAEPDTQAAQCEVALDLPPSLPAVQGNAAALQRAFQNLLSNAAKHGGSGKWIGIAAEPIGGNGSPMIEVRVSDRGPGIPKDEQAGVFKPFVRGAAAHAAQIRGSGIGLSLVREIVEAHDGEISVRSEPGHGATFIVRLPAEFQI